MFINIIEFFQFNHWKKNPSIELFSWIFLKNLLDILIIWYVLYSLVQIVKGSKVIQLIRGVAIFIAIRFLAELGGFETLSWVIDQIIAYSVIVAMIIFQPEIRKGLEHLGRPNFFNRMRPKKNKNEEMEMIYSLDKSIQYMSKRKIGALIAIQRKISLEEYSATGIPINADITQELLINIFAPNTPMHDGAVIIKDNKIIVSSSYLPLTNNLLIPKAYGARHRAAIGVSEISDAITIVVSEETGNVSIAIHDNFYTELNQQKYIKILNQELNIEKKKKNCSFIALILKKLNKIIKVKR